jgi:hypothetical protein
MKNDLIGYLKTEVLAERWDVSVRQVQLLCKSGKIKGAVKFGNTWAVPKGTRKPTRTSLLKPGRKPIVKKIARAKKVRR